MYFTAISCCYIIPAGKRRYEAQRLVGRHKREGGEKERKVGIEGRREGEREGEREKGRGGGREKRKGGM